MGEASMVNTPTCIVKAKRLEKTYKRQKALKDVSIEIPSGEIFGLIGPDGAGKSTLMKIMAGVLTFDEGAVEVFGVRLDSEASAERIKHRIGFMPQGLGLNLYAELSVEENIDFFAKIRNVERSKLAERKEKLLAMTRLDRFKNRAMKHLSGGMKQKLGLICTLIHQPELIILDEPTTGVDPVSRRDFWEILTELVHTQNITAIVSTAYLDEAERFQHLAFMYDGKIIGTGDPESLKRGFPGTVMEIMTQNQVEALTELKSIFSQVDGMGEGIKVVVDKDTSEEELIRILNGIEVNYVREIEPSLEDVFVILIRGEQSIHFNDETRILSGSIFLDRLRGEGTYMVSNEGDADGCFQGGNTVIEACNLTRDFGAFKAVDNVSFSVRQGEIFGLLGANGAGKTTLIKMLTGILQPTGGEGKVAGSDIRKAGRVVKERIGYVSQSFSLYLDLTVTENMRLFAGIYGMGGKKARTRLDEIVEIAGLRGYEDELTKKLPMGIRQRLALACAIIHSPRILFLDEPTSGVDPLGRRRFWDILTYLARGEKVAILITTHYMSEAEHCDRLALMHSGRIVANDSPRSLKAQLKIDIGELISVKTSNPVKALELLRPSFPEASFFGSSIHIFSKDVETAKNLIVGILRDERNVEISIQEPTLEDVFVSRISRLERMEQQ